MLMVRVMRLPIPLRTGSARLLTKFLPAAGSGPSGRYLTDWKWQVEATATATDGVTGSSTLPEAVIPAIQRLQP